MEQLPQEHLKFQCGDNSSFINESIVEFVEMYCRAMVR